MSLKRSYVIGLLRRCYSMIYLGIIGKSLQPRSYDHSVATVSALSRSQGSINNSKFRLGPTDVAPPILGTMPSHFSATRLIFRAMRIGLKTSVAVGNMELSKA